MGMSSWGLAPAPPAKHVVVYRNGDPFFPGRKLVVSPRRFLTFEAFLTEVTASVGASLAVRNLYTARHGHRVTALGDLQDGHQYVAAGFEKFKKLDYLRHGRTEPRGTRQSEGLQLRAAAPWKLDVMTRQQTQSHLPRTIHVFRNGDLLSPPFPVPLLQGTPWDELLATLTERAALRSGAVSRLCRLDGTPVSCEKELLNGGYYVAVGNEEYKELPYLELLVPQDSGCVRLHVVMSLLPVIYLVFWTDDFTVKANSSFPRDKLPFPDERHRKMLTGKRQAVLQRRKPFHLLGRGPE